MNPEDEQDPRAKAVKRAAEGLMDLETQEIFENLIKLNPRDLTPNDRAFLYARRGYLNDRQLDTFAEVLSAQETLAKEKLAAEAGETPELPEAKTPNEINKSSEEDTDEDLALAEELKAKKK